MNEISVIIRVKNEERWIGHAIQSVIENLPGSEIIIIDNNSTDNSIQIAKYFLKDPNLKYTDKLKYTNIKFLSIEQYTPGKSLNMGIKEASHNICFILSAHCIITNVDIDKIKNDLKIYKSIFGKQIPVWNGKKINQRYVWSHFVDREQINMFSKLENRYFHHNAAAIYDRQFIIENPFDEFLQSKEDRYWAQDIIANGHKILYDPKFAVHHHFTINGSTWRGI